MMSQKYNQGSPECGNLYRTNKLAFSTTTKKLQEEKKKGNWLVKKLERQIKR